MNDPSCDEEKNPLGFLRCVEIVLPVFFILELCFCIIAKKYATTFAPIPVPLYDPSRAKANP